MSRWWLSSSLDSAKKDEEIVNNDGTFLITLGRHRWRKSLNRPHTSSTTHSSKIITRTLTNASVSRQRSLFRPLLLADRARDTFLPKWANDRLTISRVIDFHLARDSLISMIYYEVKCAAFISGVIVENPKEISGLTRENLLQDLRLHFIKCGFSEFSKLYRGSNLNKEFLFSSLADLDKIFLYYYVNNKFEYH